nr:unnamed protein product [Callosobruchus analis]
MHYIRSKFTNLLSLFTKSAQQKEERKINKYDVYCGQIYEVLSWENPKYTLTVFLVSLFLFWIIVQLQIKFFCVLFFGLLIAFLLDAYYDNKDLTNDYKDYPDELQNLYYVMHDMMLSLKAIRKENPSSFCIGMSVFFLVITVIANSISGYMLTYLVILGTFFLPLTFKCLPEDHVVTLKAIFRSILNSKGDLMEEQLTPFICNRDPTNRDNDDADSQMTDKTAESASNSLISGLGQMPSYLDVSDIQTEIEEEDLIPHTTPHSAVSYTPAAHFNGDSSSEEEKLLSRDLSFTAIDDTSVDGADFNEQQLCLKKASPVVTGSTTSQIERKSSNSDSDFEIVNTDDIKD